jgi:hypothetical protein
MAGNLRRDFASNLSFHIASEGQAFRFNPRASSVRTLSFLLRSNCRFCLVARAAQKSLLHLTLQKN